jgi:hypothetical protein
MKVRYYAERIESGKRFAVKLHIQHDHRKGYGQEHKLLAWGLTQDAACRMASSLMRGPSGLLP